MTKNIKEVELPPLTYIDRDNAAWQAQSGFYAEQPTIRLVVKEEGKEARAVVFHTDDADMLIALIEQARDA
jgi:hypothetical protein